jgi:hypothetical protein
MGVCTENWVNFDLPAKVLIHHLKINSFPLVYFFGVFLAFEEETLLSFDSFERAFLTLWRNISAKSIVEL